MTEEKKRPTFSDSNVVVDLYGKNYQGVIRRYTREGSVPVLFIGRMMNDDDRDKLLLGGIREVFYRSATASSDDFVRATIEEDGKEREVIVEELPSHRPSFFENGTQRDDAERPVLDGTRTSPEPKPWTRESYDAARHDAEQAQFHYVDPITQRPPFVPLGYYDPAFVRPPTPAEPSGVSIQRLAKKIDEMRKVIDELVSEVKLPEQAVPEPVPVSPTVPETAAAEARRLWESDHTAFVLPPEATLTYDRHTNESVAVFDGKISITMTEERLRGLIAAGALDFFDSRGGRVHPDTEMARRRLSLSAEVADNVIRSLKSFDWARGEDKTDNG